MAQLSVNDTCPDVSFSSVINLKNSPIKLSDYRGKAIIIDFWDTRCRSCLESFPVIDSLQRKFRNDLQIILVTKQQRKTIDDFFLRLRKIKIPDVPIVTDNTELSSLFPSEGYPYIVWLDRNRVVKYLTGGYNMTSDHFENFLKGIKLNVKEVGKKTVYCPMWHLDDLTFLNNVKYYSTLTSYINNVDIGLPNGILLNDGNLVQLSSNGSTLLTLIKKAVGENGKYPVNSKYGMEFTMDGTQLTRPADPNQWDEWDKKNKFNYQLILPASRKELLYQTMREDLERYFDLEIERVQKKIKGYVLTNLNSNPIPGSKITKKFDAYNDANGEADDTLHFYNQPLERLEFLLSYWIRNTFPFKSLIDEQEQIDFIIRKNSINPLNIKQLNEDLSKINLLLKEREIETSVVVVRQKNKGCF